MDILAKVVYQAIHIYIMLIFVWVLGSWFPQWQEQAWFKVVRDIVAPYINLFKFLPLRIGMMDLTPLAAMFVLMLVQGLISGSMSGRVM